MRKILIAGLICSSVLFAFGCSSDETTTDPGAAPQTTDSGSTPEAKPMDQAGQPAQPNGEQPAQGATAVEAQCAECMLNFDKTKMKEIEGRWYCEGCAAKKG